MSSFLSVAKNVARQSQNVRHDIEKRRRKKAERLSWCWRVIIGLFLVCAIQEKCFNNIRQLYLYFWYHCEAVDAP